MAGFFVFFVPFVANRFSRPIDATSSVPLL